MDLEKVACVNECVELKDMRGWEMLHPLWVHSCYNCLLGVTLAPNWFRAYLQLLTKMPVTWGKARQPWVRWKIFLELGRQVYTPTNAILNWCSAYRMTSRSPGPSLWACLSRSLTTSCNKAYYFRTNSLLRSGSGILKLGWSLWCHQRILCSVSGKWIWTILLWQHTTWRRGKNFQEWAVPISLHGDDVPVTGVGKAWVSQMTTFSLCSMINKGETKDMSFFIYGCFERLRVVDEDQSKDTLGCFFKLLVWSLEWLYKGQWPDRDHNGKLSLGYSFCELRVLSRSESTIFETNIAKFCLKLFNF